MVIKYKSPTALISMSEDLLLVPRCESVQTLRSEASKGRELVAMAREDARESRLCKQQLEKDLAEATHEV